MLVECYGGHRRLTELLVYIDVFTPVFKINKAGKSYILGTQEVANSDIFSKEIQLFISGGKKTPALDSLL